MKNTNTNTTTKTNYDLRGSNNFETALNTVNALIGMASTTVMTSAHLVANGTELVLTHAIPKEVADAIVHTAKGAGVMSTWDSIMSEASTKAATDYIYAVKDRWIGASSRKADKALSDAVDQLDGDSKSFVKEAIAAAYKVGVSSKDIMDLALNTSLAEAITTLGEKYEDVAAVIKAYATK